MSFVVMMAFNLLLAYATRPKTQAQEISPGTVAAPRISEGTELPVVFGTCALEPLYFWAGDGDADAIYSEGGKK